VAGLVEVDDLGLGSVAILDVDQAVGHALAQDLLDGLGHGAAGLAPADDVDVVVAAQIVGSFANAQRLV